MNEFTNGAVFFPQGRLGLCGTHFVDVNVHLHTVLMCTVLMCTCTLLMCTCTVVMRREDLAGSLIPTKGI